MAPQQLCIIGGGPKGVAVAAKAQVLRGLGLEAPDIQIVEAGRIGHHWRRSGGWTDGRQSLGTSPFKDLGFPYGTEVFPAEHPVNRAMFDLGWSAYLAKTGRFAKWTDRGGPSPTHKEWAAYMEWVAAETNLSVVHGEALSIDRTEGERFKVAVAGSEPVVSDAIMFTGFGGSDRKLAPECVSVREFWMDRAKDERYYDKRVVIIGSGETAASITRCIIDRAHPADVVVVSPTETIYSRGESYLENRLYSDPARWAALSETQRRDFIRRTDRAVFSQDVQSLISSHGIHRHLQGRVSDVTAAEGAIVAQIHNSTTNSMTSVETDVVIDARGGNPLWFLDLLTPTLRVDIAMRCEAELTAASLEKRIEHDMSISGYPAKIFVPNLAALRQGPGFPNLSSLGLLSDRVLSGMLPKENNAGTIAGMVAL